jgi:hypothetical protein
MASVSPARLRTFAAWTLSAALLAAFVVLGDGDEGALDDEPQGDTGQGRQVEIVSVKPSDPYPGSSLIVSYDGAVDPALLHVYAAKAELPVVARRAGSVVARLPADIAAGDLKVRLAIADELGQSERAATKRSKAYHVRVKPVRWHKILRDVLGGFALLVLGIRSFTRGAREATGLGEARRLARAMHRRWVALAFGVLLGATAQSTTAAAGVLAGLVSPRLIAVAPAALAFLGAQLGAVAAPLALSGLIAPRDALVLVVFGVLWSAFARARRARAFARLLLGAGLIAYGLEVMRPSAEPFALHPLLMSLGTELRADGIVASVRCALLGAGLVAVLQGPMPVIVLVLAVAHTTGRWDLHTAFAVLAGSGLGAALSALVITPGGERCRELARVNLILGALTSALALAGGPLWCALAEHWAGADVAASPAWQARALPLAIAFLSAQLCCALLLLPVASRLVRGVPAPGRDARVTHDAAHVRTTLLAVIDDQRAALAATFDLARDGMRDDGNVGERRLESARAALDRLLRDPLGGGAEPDALAPLARIAFGSVQLQRALERLLFEVESLTDRRIGDGSADAQAVPGSTGADERVLHEMQSLLDSGIEALRQSLRTATPLDLDAAREREIGINAIEAQVRAELPALHARPDTDLRLLGLLRVIDAYEGAGNQVYRLAEVLGEAPVLEPLDALAPRQQS